MSDRIRTDVAIVGAGPGGTIASMMLAREGIRSVMVEKEVFPRFRVGESMTGESGRILRDLGLESDMRRLGFPVKHGLSVYGPAGETPWFVPVSARDGDWDLVPTTTWNVLRSSFDEMLLERALERGGDLVRGRATAPVLDEQGVVRGLDVRTGEGPPLRIEAELVLDCSGPNTFLQRAGLTGPKYMGIYDRQIAIYAHVRRADSLGGDTPETAPGNTVILYQKKYHWAWYIPVGDDLVSVGIVVPAATFRESGLSKADYLKREMRSMNPGLARRTAEAEIVSAVYSAVNYSYQVERFTGRGFICVGDAHRFMDPIFAFGLFISMREPELALPYIKTWLEGERRDEERPFLDYEIQCERGQDVMEDAIDMFWEYPIAFASFVHRRHRELMRDLFAPRVYDTIPEALVRDFRRALRRERAYDPEGSLYSVPVGSRYDPERAEIWDHDGMDIDVR